MRHKSLAGYSNFSPYCFFIPIIAAKNAYLAAFIKNSSETSNPVFAILSFAHQIMVLYGLFNFYYYSLKVIEWETLISFVRYHKEQSVGICLQLAFSRPDEI